MSSSGTDSKRRAQQAAEQTGDYAAHNTASDAVRPPEIAGRPDPLLALLRPPQADGELGRLANFAVTRLLGRGGMGAVFAADDLTLHRRVALKVMRPDLTARPEARERFLREAQTAGGLEHDHIIPVYHVGEDNGVLFIAMPLLKGEPLDERLKREGRLPIAAVMKLGRETAEGLAAAHAQGLVHRDIKPANLWLEGTGDAGGVGFRRVKVLDFGLARAVQDDQHLTAAGGVLGTPAYMAPEQAAGEEVDHRTDLFGLGAVLYRCCAGVLPFSGPNAMAALSALATKDAVPVGEKNPDAPAALADLIMRLLAKAPGDRPQSAEEVAEALRRIEQEQATVTAAAAARIETPNDPPPALPRRRRGVWLGVAGVTGLLLAALAAWLVYFGRPTPPRATLPPDGVERKVVWTPGPADGVLPGLIARPARLPGIRRWQLETQLPRSEGTSVSWSPDGKLIAYGDKGGRIRLIDADTRRLVQLLPGHVGGVNAVAWSPDGAWLASAGADKTVRLWRADGTRGPVLMGHTNWVHCVAWSKDGKRLASGGDGDVRIWSVDGTPGPVLPHETSVYCVAWSPDGQTLASADTYKKLIRLWNSADGTPLTTLGPVPGDLNALAWSPDGKYLASGGGDIAAEHAAGWIWDVAEKKRVVPLAGTHGRLNWLGWSAEGGLASQTHDEYVVLFDPRNGEIAARTAQSSTSRSESASWSPEGGRIADDNSIYTVSKGGREITPTGFQPSAWAVAAVAWSPESKRLASSGGCSVVRLWDADGTPGPLLQTNARYILTVAWSPDGTRLAAGIGTNVQLWNADGTAGPVLQGHEDIVDAVAWSPDGKHLASPHGTIVRLWDVDGTPGPVLRDNKEAMGAVAWSSDGKRLAGAGGGGKIQLWDADGTPGPVLPGGAWVNGLAWNPGERLASADSDGAVRLWNKDGSPGPVLTGHEARVFSVAWSPDGKRLASGDEKGMVRLWDADGTPRPVLRGHESVVTSVAWSGDGMYLASASNDSTLRVWDAGGEPEWMAVQLPDGKDAVFSAAGELLHGDPDSVEKGLVYLVEQDDGHIAYLQPSEFWKAILASNKPKPGR